MRATGVRWKFVSFVRSFALKFANGFVTIWRAVGVGRPSRSLCRDGRQGSNAAAAEA